jgi:hypothetical protein
MQFQGIANQIATCSFKAIGNQNQTRDLWLQGNLNQNQTPRLVRFQELSLDPDPIKKTGDYYFWEPDLTPTYYHKPGLGYLNVWIFELELVAFGPVVELSSFHERNSD